MSKAKTEKKELERRKKISEARKGKSYEEFYGKEKAKEIKKKQSNSKKEAGIVPPSRKGKENPNKGKKFSREVRERMSRGQKKRFEKEDPWNKGKKCPEMRGENHPNWKEGSSFSNKSIRKTFEYRQWRSDIFTRDDFTCQECGKRGGTLRAHHIKLFSLIIKENNIESIEEARKCEELWNLNNGITLCKECHLEIHKKDESNYEE